MRTFKFNCKTTLEKNDVSETKNILIEVQAENAEAAEELAREQYLKQIDDDAINKELDANMETTHIDQHVEATFVK